MSEEDKRMLQQQLWNIANTLRGKMGADEFRDYILGFIFYKYLSEKMEMYANTLEDGLNYAAIDDSTELGKEQVVAVFEEAIPALGYTLKPSELFSNVAKRGNANEEGASSFILGDLTTILNNIEKSTMGTESEDDFDNLFEDLDLTSSKLGKTETQKNELIAKVLAHLDNINFNLADKSTDVLGDAYEYLIGQFASGAGKKAGEFYTPQQVSVLMSEMIAHALKDRKEIQIWAPLKTHHKP